LLIANFGVDDPPRAPGPRPRPLPGALGKVEMDFGLAVNHAFTRLNQAFTISPSDHPLTVWASINLHKLIVTLRTVSVYGDGLTVLAV
jgi:hypothetical protein